MTPTIEIDVRDQIQNDLQRIAARAESADIAEAIGLAGVEEVREFYTRLDHERANAMGGQRTHFYAQAAESATFSNEGDSVLLEVPEPVGLAFRIHGGTITAGKGVSSKTGQPTKYLTIPALAEAYGHRAGEFDNLVVMYRRIGGTVRAVGLMEAQSQDVSFRGGKVRRGQLRGQSSTFKIGGTTVSVVPKVLFWLVKSITSDADPSAAPDENAVVGRALAAVRDFFGDLQGGVTA